MGLPRVRPRLTQAWWRPENRPFFLEVPIASSKDASAAGLDGRLRGNGNQVYLAPALLGVPFSGAREGGHDVAPGFRYGLRGVHCGDLRGLRAYALGAWVVVRGVARDR